MKYISFSKVLFVSFMALAALGHHYMWQNWDFLQNNPYMFIVTTIVMGIILFFGEGTIAAMFRVLIWSNSLNSDAVKLGLR